MQYELFENNLLELLENILLLGDEINLWNNMFFDDCANKKR